VPTPDHIVTNMPTIKYETAARCIVTS